MTTTLPQLDSFKVPYKCWFFLRAPNSTGFPNFGMFLFLLVIITLDETGHKVTGKKSKQGEIFCSFYFCSA
jgi:hypothetical protein